MGTARGPRDVAVGRLPKYNQPLENLDVEERSVRNPMCSHAAQKLQVSQTTLEQSGGINAPCGRLPQTCLEMCKHGAFHFIMLIARIALILQTVETQAN